MRGLVLFGFVLATVSAELVGINTNYFDTVGIPLARQIKEYEDSLVLNADGTVNPRIVGGVVSPISSYPYLVSLLYAYLIIVLDNSLIVLYPVYFIKTK